MTSPFLRALAGEAVWPPPIWLMRQAGRYLPEYREVRAKAGGMLDLCLSPDFATEVTLQPIRRYGFDAAILFSDLPLLCWALGQNLRYEEGEGPLLDPIRDSAALTRLNPSRVASAVSPVLETVRRLRTELPADCALIGFAGSPWTVACYMVEGRGSKEFAAARMMAYADPPLFAALTDLLVEQTADYLCMQIEAGADAVMLFDSWAGVLPAAAFRQHVMQPTRRIVELIHARHPAAPVIGFPPPRRRPARRIRRGHWRAGRGRGHRGRPGVGRRRHPQDRGRARQPRSPGLGGRWRVATHRHPTHPGRLARPAGYLQSRPWHRPRHAPRARRHLGAERAPCLTQPSPPPTLHP